MTLALFALAVGCLEPVDDGSDWGPLTMSASTVAAPLRAITRSGAASPTPCAQLEPAAIPHGALPDDDALAAWTISVEETADAYLALRALESASSPPPGERAGVETVECAYRLWNTIRFSRLPPQSVLRLRAARMMANLLIGDAVAAARVAEEGGDYQMARALFSSAGLVDDAARAAREEEREQAFGSMRLSQHRWRSDVDGWEPAMKNEEELLHFVTELPDDRRAKRCGDGLPAFLAPFRDVARYRRALVLHYAPCVLDNFSSFDDDLDVVEPLLRLTAEVVPARLGMTLDLLASADVGARGTGGPAWRWSDTPFMRIPGDLGPSGNALRLFRDLLVKDPDARPALLRIASQRAITAASPSRGARWMGCGFRAT
jgi:hypothetical protein